MPTHDRFYRPRLDVWFNRTREIAPSSSFKAGGCAPGRMCTCKQPLLDLPRSPPPPTVPKEGGRAGRKHGEFSCGDPGSYTPSGSFSGWRAIWAGHACEQTDKTNKDRVYYVLESTDGKKEYATAYGRFGASLRLSDFPKSNVQTATGASQLIRDKEGRGYVRRPAWENSWNQRYVQR